MDRDLAYLGVTVALLIVVAGAHNLTVGEDDALSFGYCDTTIRCDGVSAAGMCVGVQQLDTQCYDPSNASTHRTVEAECAAQAQNLCYSGYSGTAWASNATYDGTTCEQWAEQDDRITLLGCDETSPPASEWSSIG